MAQVDLANTYSDRRNEPLTPTANSTPRLATIDQARAAVGREEYRLSFLNTATLFYNSYIDFLVEHGQINDALRIAEHSRARTLAEGLGLKPVSLNSTLAPEQTLATAPTPSSSNTGSSPSIPTSGQSRRTRSHSSSFPPTPKSMPPYRTTARPCSARAIRSRPAMPLAASSTTCSLRPHRSSSAPARA